MNKKLSSNHAFRFLTVILIPLILLVICANFLPSYYEKMLLLFLVNVILAASLNLTNGFTGIFSMGHAGFMAIGAYLTALFVMDPELKLSRISDMPAWLASIHIPFWVALLIAGFIAMGIAALIGIPVLKAKGDYLSVMTLGLIVIIKGIIENNDQFTNGSRGISGIPNQLNLPIVVIITIITLFVLYKVVHSSFGRNMLAIREDEQAAVSLGINAAKYKLLSLSVGAFFGAVGGSLWAMLQGTISPGYFYFDQTFSIVEMSVLGGMYTLSGAIPGAAIITFLPQFLSNLETGIKIGSVQLPVMYGLSNIIMSLIFILVILFRRQGIAGKSEYIVDTLFRKETYLEIFKGSTWKELAGIVKAMFSYKKVNEEETL